MSFLRKLDLPPVWFLLSVAIIWLTDGFLPPLDVPYSQPAAMVMAGAGLGLGVWAAVWFYLKRTPIEPFHTPTAFIIEGPFQITRNPIYLAMVLFSTSATLWTGSALGLLTTSLLWLILDRRFVVKEEEVLRDLFGSEAREFFQETRRWF